MTTPHQGPGMWQQGNRDQALDWLANLDARQQQALQRAMNTHQALGPIYAAANRVQQISSWTAQRLSEAAVATGRGVATAAQATGRGATNAAQATGRGAVTAAQVTGQAASSAAQTTGRVATTAAQATGAAVVNAAQATGRAAATAAQATGAAVVNAAQATGAAAVNAGRQVADTSRQVYGKVSRWFQDRVSNGTNRANAARAAFAAFRKDPTLNQTNIGGKDISALSARAQALISAQTPEARAAAAEQLIQAASGLQGAEQQGTGRHRADGHISAQWISAGQGLPGTKPQQPQQNPQGQAPQTGAQSQTQQRNDPGQSR